MGFSGSGTIRKHYAVHHWLLEEDPIPLSLTVSITLNAKLAELGADRGADTLNCTLIYQIKYGVLSKWVTQSNILY